MPIISFDRAVEYYDETRGLVPGAAEKIRDAILDYTHVPPPARFLELGIGTGRIALPFIEAGYVFDGTDISLAMMGKLEQKLVASNQARQAYRCHLVQNNITQTFPFTAGAYDVAILVHVLHLVEDWQTVLSETRRVLRPNGSWLLIGGTDQGRSNDDDIDPATREANPVSPIRLVRRRWNEILRDLGVDVKRGSAARKRDADYKMFLQGMGALVETVTLAEYDQPAISPRMLADRFKARMHSAEWSLSDDLHAEAVRQLDYWLQTDCPEPNVTVVGKGMFTIQAAHWTQ